MVFNISPAEYNLTGLNDCCSYEPAVTTAYCGAAQVNGSCGSGSQVFDSNGNPATGIYSCNVGAPNGTSCAAFPGSSYIGVTTVDQYVSSGSCVLKTSASSCESPCNNGLPITQSIDVCNLAAAAYAQLAPDTLNMFGAPCITK